MRRFILAGCLAAISFGMAGCGGKEMGAIEIPEDNPYQQTPEEIAEYNRKGAENMQNMMPAKRKK